MNELKKALKEKIREYRAYLKDPNHQTEMEQNAVMVTLKELLYLDTIVDYSEDENGDVDINYDFHEGRGEDNSIL